jgi:hypothetical protein
MPRAGNNSVDNRADEQHRRPGEGNSYQRRDEVAKPRDLESGRPARTKNATGDQGFEKDDRDEEEPGDWPSVAEHRNANVRQSRAGHRNPQADDDQDEDGGARKWAGHRKLYGLKARNVTSCPPPAPHGLQGHEDRALKVSRRYTRGRGRPWPQQGRSPSSRPSIVKEPLVLLLGCRDAGPAVRRPGRQGRLIG